MAKKIFSPVAPSETIREIFHTESSCSIDCEHCGRTHFDQNGEAMEDGELEDLLKKAAADPDGYISHDGFVAWGRALGKQVVVDCPCHFLTEFEKVIWGHRFQISRYLVARAKEHLEAAKRSKTAADATRVVKKT